MNFRVILLIILGFLFFNSLTYSHAYIRVDDGDGDEITDSTRRRDDSLRAARTRIADSIREARTYHADSLKLARKYIADSIQMVRKFKADSTAAIRKYHDSKQYKDSVANARRHPGSSSTAGLTGPDSVKAARKHVADSMTAARIARTDSIHATQKHRADSLASVKKYKTSKRYTDSVSIVRHDRMDSVRKVQQAARDNLAGIRKHTLDSTKAVRKHQGDSLKTVRTKHLDSVKLVRKTKTDSLAKAKADKEKLVKAKEKKKNETNKLKLELKLKQKHEAWSNKSMLKKRWSPVRKVTQNSFTHYNYYFNANRKMEEARLNMQRSHHDNFDSLIGLYPYDPNKDSLLLAADMDSIIRKVSVGIQIHDPRVKWSNDMYLLLGQAYYYKGSYENAAIAFRYIIATDEEKKKKQAAANKSKEGPSILEDEKKSKLDFLKHKSVHNEAVLWLARTYTSAHQVENAESILSLLETDVKLPDNLKGQMAVEKANVYLAQNSFPEATKQLSIAADDHYLPDWLRMRAAFLNGQIQQNMDEHKQAANSFEHVLTYYPKLEMDFYSRKYAAINRLQSGQNIEDAARPLRKILNDGKYTSYYDQVYYALGQLSAKANRKEEAISYYSKSINTPRATRKQKALSFSAMGDMYYSTGRYAYAKKAYDSAAKYTPSSAKDKNMVATVQKSKGLAEISAPANIIHDEDSLLALATMSKRDQQAAVHRYLKLLEKQKQDSIANAEAGGGAPPEPEATAAAGGADASNWYFANPMLVTQGSMDFKRKWGNRPLTDNWRRSAAVPLASGSSQAAEEENTENAEAAGGDQLTESALLAKIPTTPQQKEAAQKIEQKAYLQLAKAYVKQLEDYKQAIHTLDTLDARYPKHSLKEDELYLRYQIAVRQNKLDLAQKYSEELLSLFPQSQYAALLKPRKSESGGGTGEKPVAAYFDETYHLLMQHQYTEALMRINNGKRLYSDPVYAKRFEIAEASAYAGMGNYDKADTVISTFMRANTGDTLIVWAMSVKNYISEVRNGGKPSWYKETPPGAVPVAEPPKAAVTEEKKAAKEIPLIKPDIPAMYTYHADSPHYSIIVLPGLDSRTASLKTALKAFNSSNYGPANLDMLIDMYDMNLGVLVIGRFANAADTKAYIATLLASGVLHDYKPEEVHVMAITTANYKKMFADKDAAAYYSFYNAYYK